jgi:hypothetical protein
LRIGFLCDDDEKIDPNFCPAFSLKASATELRLVLDDREEDNTSRDDSVLIVVAPRGAATRGRS